MSFLSYYLGTSYRRKSLDALLGSCENIYRGVVLDIGGRERGNWRKPISRVAKWIVADKEPKRKPDIILDVQDMNGIPSESIDVINAIELFEHVSDISKSFHECFRVLKIGGTLILSIAFLYPIHNDPSDYQRWTIDKLTLEIQTAGFHIQRVVVMGGYFTTIAEFTKIGICSLPKAFRWFFYLIFPLLDLCTWMDQTCFIKESPILKYFHGGYFIVAHKLSSTTE